MAGNYAQSVYDILTGPSGAGVTAGPPPAPTLADQTYAAMAGPSGSMVEAPPAPPPTPSGGSYEDWAAENIGGGTLAAPPAGAPMSVPAPELAGPTEPAAPTAPADGAMARPVISMASTGGSGFIPAHEASRLGPSQWGALQAGNEAAESAVGQVAQNSQQQAANEEATYLAHARDAKMREDAANVAALEREEEMARRSADFDRSAKELSQQRIDPDRFWASRSTPQKVGAFISIALGGFLQGARGGPNLGLEMINTHVERDIRAQEFSYMAKRDSLEAARTAFGQAVQKYGSVDAARSFARVAAMDAVSAEIARQMAAGKGTDAANRGQLALAEIAQARADQIVKGIQFIPAQRVAVEPRYHLANRLGTYTAREVDKMLAEEEGRGFELEKIDRKEGAELKKEEAKAHLKGQQDAREQKVELPNGDVVRAPSSAEASKLRELSTAVSNAQQLVTRAQQLRKGMAWRIPGTQDRAELEQIQSELTLAFKDRGQLGALSGPDMDLALAATGDLTAQRSTADVKLAAFQRATNNALRNRVKTLPDAPDTAKGRMPASFEPAGKK